MPTSPTRPDRAAPQPESMLTVLIAFGANLLIAIAKTVAAVLTGAASNADPVCSKSPQHNLILKAREEAEHATQTIEQLAFRNDRNSRLIAKG